MVEKFQDQFRVPSARLKNWDYGKNGAYFITICIHNKEFLFGEVVEKNNHAKFKANKLGELAEIYWLEIVKQFPYVELGNFVIMPNHVHGILIINKPVETRFIASLLNTSSSSSGVIPDNKNPMLNNSISRIIRWYKGRCSFEIRKIKKEFSWQSRFYEHIIKDSESFEKIQDYILKNPQTWKEDKYYKPPSS